MGLLTGLGVDRRATKLTGGNLRDPEWWVKLFGGSAETISGIDVTADSALQYSPVWLCTNLITGAIGSLPLILYKRVDEGKERARGHVAFKLIHDRPNPQMSAQTFRETLQGHVLLWGNGYARIVMTGGGRPSELWPLLPDRTEPEVTTDNTVIYRVRHDNMQDELLDADEVLHIHGLGFDGIRGYSVISDYARNSLSVGISAERFTGAFFRNGSQMPGIINYPDGVLDDGAVKRYQQQWRDKYSGVDNMHKIPVLEAGLTWQSIGIPPEDAQMLGTLKFGISDVARWFNVPLHMLHELDRATFANSEVQGLDFVKWTISTWMRRWEQEINFKLLTEPEREDFFVEFLSDALLRGDTAARYSSYQIGRQGGFLTVNEIRARENLESVGEAGDVLLAPLNMVPASGEGEGNEGGVPPAPDTPAGGTRSVESDFILDAWKRIIRKEVKALGRMLKSPEKFVDLSIVFYGQHFDYVRGVLAPARADVRKIARQHVLDQLKSLRDCGETPDAMVGPFGLFSRWEREVPADRTFQMTGMECAIDTNAQGTGETKDG